MDDVAVDPPKEIGHRAKASRLDAEGIAPLGAQEVAKMLGVHAARCICGAGGAYCLHRTTQRSTVRPPGSVTRFSVGPVPRAG